MSTPTREDEISFAFFAELVDAFAQIKPHKASEKQPRDTRYVDTPEYQTFRRWVLALRERHSPLPPDTAAVVFRLLFPEEDIHRKYGLQETRLAQHLVKILGVSSETQGRGKRLQDWNGDDAVGCLGEEVKDVVAATTHSQASTVCVTLHQVDALLTELASRCKFSESSVRASFSAAAPPRSRKAILTTLYTSLTPAECAVVTQIILKDLRPLLRPIPCEAAHYTAALLQYKSNAVSPLTKEAAMHAWDPSGRLRMIYKTRADLSQATRTFDRLRPGDAMPEPLFGMPIQIPKCVKGQGAAQSLRTLKGADRIWVETKYDGERAQIHVRLDKDGCPHIKIFSKSGRDSTQDRAGIHGVICDALGILQEDSSQEASSSDHPAFRREIIIEAEMVAYSDVLHRIDEFWRIRSLIASTAIGVRHKTPPRELSSMADARESQCSLMSNVSDGGTRHLALVFFDILLLDGVSLLSSPYSERRAILEQTVKVIPGYSMLAERECIDMWRADALATLRSIFAGLIADHQEGAVLKADGAQYGEKRSPWVKLKRDYIPGYGDCVDLVLLGASWEKERARELRVIPTAYTTFYFGAHQNADAYKQNPACKPHFDVIFTSSYGLSREQLEELNFIVKNSDPVPCRGKVASNLPYSYTLCSNLSPPTILLPKPLLVELFGAGFTKAQGSLIYELRFPRISKFYRPSDRPWTDGASLADYQLIARQAVGRDRPGKEEDDWVRTIFRPDQLASPGVRCSQKRKQTEVLWIEKLELADAKLEGKGSPSKRARVDGAGSKRRAANVENAGNAIKAGNALYAGYSGGLEGAGSGSLRTKAGLTRLASVTNLPASPTPMGWPYSGPATDIPSLTHPSPSKAIPAQKCVDRTATIADTAALDLPLISRPAGATNPLGALPQTPPPTVVKVPRHSTILESEQDRTPIVSSLKTTPGTTLHYYLQDALVWLARTSGTPRPFWRAPSHAVIPMGNQVHALDALLLACGWDMTPACSWAKRGVIFVDLSEHGLPAMQQAMSTLAARKASLLEEDSKATHRSILVFDMKMMAYEALGMNLTEEEMESKAICRFS